MITYRSKYEARVAIGLEKANISFHYEPFKLPYEQRIRGATCGDCSGTNIHVIRHYTPDFVLPGTNIIIEAKGKFEPSNRTKMLELIEHYGTEWDFRMLFMYDNWLTRKKKQRYSDWCDRYDIAWAKGPAIPEHWRKEILKCQLHI